jgi:hypothetical protein
MIAKIDHALSGFLWFLSLAVTGAGFIPTGIILVALVVAGLLSYRRGDYAERGHISILLVLPLPWIFIGVWGAWWFYSGGPRNPDWVNLPVGIGVVVEILLIVGLVYWLRGIRLVAAIFCLLNLYLLLAMAFIASMAISGTWL